MGVYVILFLGEIITFVTKNKERKQWQLGLNVK